MNARRQTLRLRLELLRMRAQIERAEIAAAVVDLQVGTRRIRQIGAVASSLGAAASGGTGGWLGQIVGALSQRPWITAVVIGVLRSARRHPWLALVAVSAVVVAARWQRRGDQRAGSSESEPTPAPSPSADETGD
jgi:hypothetical protein